MSAFNLKKLLDSQNALNIDNLRNFYSIGTPRT